MGPGLSHDQFPHAFGGNINTPDSNGIVGASEHGQEETSTPADSPDNNGGFPRPWEWGGSGGGGDDRKKREKENKKIIKRNIPDIDAETLEDWGSIMTNNQEREEKKRQEEMKEKKRQRDLEKELKKRKKQNKQKE